MGIVYLFILLILTICLHVTVEGDDSYENIKRLQDSILSSSSYSSNLRPLVNQSKPIVVSVTFSLVAVVSLDNVKQELVTNGFLFLFWDDERNSWNPEDYGGFTSLTPAPKEVWRPRLLLINTLGKRDPFEDDYSHSFFHYEGDMGWIPGGLFNTYCALNMEKFPFDIQNCKIQMCPMSHTNVSVQFEARDDVNLAFYYPNPGWELLKAYVTIENVSVIATETFSCPTFHFRLKRRPTLIILTVIIPVIFLSILNNLVFLIPVDSGEKVSYGRSPRLANGVFVGNMMFGAWRAITVLLALTVFLSMVSTMTPQVSDVVPALTIYLFVLLLSSVLTVGAAIFTVHLHNLEEKEENSINTDAYKSTNKFSIFNRSVTPVDNEKDGPPEESHDTSGKHQDTSYTSGHSPYKLIVKHIDKLFFLIMNAATLISTMWYLISTNA